MLNAPEAAQRLASYDNILILTHVRPDGDTVGSAAALCAGLRAIGKTAYLLPNGGVTKNTLPYFAPYVLSEDFTPEKIVTADIASLGLFPDNAAPYKEWVDLAIDHHPSFENFGRENIVWPEAAACGEIVYEILRQLTPITKEIALPLYLAIATDTGCFAYANTTANTHAVAAALLRTGIDYRETNKTFFRTKSKKRLQLEAAMLSDCHYYDHDRVAVLAVPLALMEAVQAGEGDAEDLSALGPQIEGVDCAVTMKEKGPGLWKVSLRTGPRVNATEVCRVFGGGGHAAAAGCVVKGRRQEAERRILEAVAQVAGDFAPSAE